LLATIGAVILSAISVERGEDIRLVGAGEAEELTGLIGRRATEDNGQEDRHEQERLHLDVHEE